MKHHIPKEVTELAKSNSSGFWPNVSMLIICQSVTQEPDYLVLLWLNAKKREKSERSIRREEKRMGS